MSGDPHVDECGSQNRYLFYMFWTPIAETPTVKSCFMSSLKNVSSKSRGDKLTWNVPEDASVH
ncbi:hypothetical protein ABVT39_013926 [Epinephelus coioides]